MSKVNIPRDASVREVLNALDQYFLESLHANALWHVLSALRGPDSRHEKAKVITRALRATAFPVSAGKYGGARALVYPEFGLPLSTDDLRTLKNQLTPDDWHFSEHGHFYEHAGLAAEALWFAATAWDTR